MQRKRVGPKWPHEVTLSLQWGRGVLSTGRVREIAAHSEGVVWQNLQEGVLKRFFHWSEKRKGRRSA